MCPTLCSCGTDLLKSSFSSLADRTQLWEARQARLARPHYVATSLRKSSKARPLLDAMSELSASAASFKKQAKSAEIIPRFRVQPKQNVENEAHDSTTDEPSRKRVKIEAPVRPIYSQPDASTAGKEVITNMHYVMQYLKQDGNQLGKTTAELESYLSQGSLQLSLTHILRHNERIHYDAKSDTYSFRPVYNVRSSPQLLTLLESQVICRGLLVKDLKEGWPNCYDELDDLEDKGQILLIRNKKDDRPKTVWRSSLEYATTLDQEFVDIFRNVSVPGRDQLPRELESLGLKPTSVDPMTVVNRNGKQETKQRKPSKRKTKTTNTHMSGLKDLGLRK